MSLIERVYKGVIRPRVFAQSRGNAELAHEWGLQRMERMQNHPTQLAVARMMLTHSDPVLETRVFGIDFPNPFGLAAGFDKYCQVYWGAVPAMGWGFVEVGGITPLPQEGNPQPRMWRSEKHQAFCNAMGFNNPGKDAASAALCKHRCRVPVMLNIGKGKDTPLDRAVEDYCAVLETLWHLVDCITINVSSPNTKDLRSLQAIEFLIHLLAAVQVKNRQMAKKVGAQPKPVGVKVSPDETDEDLSDIVTAARRNKLSYLIAANTTMSRSAELVDAGFPSDRGGVSGLPLRRLARRTLTAIYRELKGEIPIISVGAINNGAELYDRILNGASLGQGLTAWPFEGPDFAKRTLMDLARRLKRDGFTNVSQAVGAAVKI